MFESIDNIIAGEVKVNTRPDGTYELYWFDPQKKRIIRSQLTWQKKEAAELVAAHIRNSNQPVERFPIL